MEHATRHRHPAFPLRGRGYASSEKPAPMDLSHHYSAVTKRRQASKLKQAYKFFQVPGILNFAGGLPNAAFFPFDTLEAQAAKPVRWTPSPNHPSKPAASSSTPDPAAATHIAVPHNLDETDPLKKIDVASALQYGLAQGYPPLLSWVRQFTREHLHPNTPYRDGPEIVMSCGNTDGFSKTLNLFVDQWTEGVNPIAERPGLLCEGFVYPAVLNQSQPLGVQVVTVQADAAGMAVDGPGGLEDVLANWDSSKGKRPHLMYTVTLGHNPTGIVISVERKKQIYAICSKYDVIIVEDEPYWYLQFPSAASEEAKSRGLPLPDPSPPHKAARSSGFPFLDYLTPSFLDLDTDGRVVRLDTFSKTVAPGCRLGWITAAPAVIERFERITEATTAQPSGFVQSLISELVLGSSPQAQTARTAFSLLRSPRDQAAFKGWDMAGWVRWLEGLRGTYERRMTRMCRVLDEGCQLVTASSLPSTDDDHPDSEWALQSVSAIKLYTFSWPRGGMFIWLRVHFESHPLWQHPTSSSSSSSPNPTKTQAQTTRLLPLPPLLNGPALASALFVFLTTRPHRVLVGSGSMFAANDAIRDGEGWAHLRLCFAAEEEDNVDLGAERFVAGLRAFWEVRDVKVMEKLLGELEVAQLSASAGVDEEGEEVCRLGWLTGMGC